MKYVATALVAAGVVAFGLYARAQTKTCEKQARLNNLIESKRLLKLEIDAMRSDARKCELQEKLVRVEHEIYDLQIEMGI